MRQKEFRDLVGGILGAEESFQHDVLGALCIDDLSTEIEVLENESDGVVMHCWWKRLCNKFDKKFVIQPGDTPESVIRQFKAYLFDLTIMVINQR